ncbi:MAG: ATP-binding protein [Ignavibacterium sp.]|nr:ATP-binding protein [Ignavibacterium sp.]
MKILSPIFVIIFLSEYFLAQNQEYVFINVTKKANLSQHFISAIIEDDNGIMWFGTHDGLNYFDGYGFKRFANKPKDKNSLSSNFITALEKDNEGNLWIGTNDGLNKLDLRTERFTVYKKNDDPNSLGDNAIIDLKYDKRGFLWIATRYDGLYKFNIKTQNFIKKIRNSPSYNFNFLENIKEIELDSDGDLWILYDSKGLVFYDYDQDKFILLDIKNDLNIPVENIHCISILPPNNLLLFIRGLGLAYINKKSFSFNKELVQDSFNKKYYQNLSILSNDIITSRDGLVYFADYNNGLMRYDIKNKKYYFSNEFIYNPIDSLDKITNKLYIDSRDNLWIGSSGFGIGLLSKNIKPFITYKSDFETGKFKLSFPSVRAIFEDKNGDIYVGGYNGLNRINSKDKSIDFLLDKPCYMIKPDIFGSDNHLTLSFESFEFGGTLYRFNKKNRELKKLFNNINSNYVRCILTDSQSNVWIGMFRGLFLFDKNNSKIKPFTSLPFDLSNETINQIYEDSQNNLWISTRGKGIFFFNISNNRWYNINKESEYFKGLTGNNVYGVFEDSKNRIWVYTSSGLNLLDRNTNSFINFTEENGLINNVVYSIIEDDSGYYWLSSNLGITRFNYENKDFWNFDIRDGIACNEKNFNAALKGKSGNFYFGGISGLTIFNPNFFKKNTKAPKVLLTEVDIIPNTDNISKLYNAYTNTIELKPNQKTLTLGFTAISDYATDIKSRYRYKIIGLHDDWIDVGFKREITLANLSHGDYKLLVSASNNDGIWSNKPFELSIIVLPEFYQTTWFRIIVIILGISFLVGIFILRIRFLKNTNLRLEKLVNERTIELENSKRELEIANSTKNKFFSIIAHDLKNPFNALINYSDILLTDFDILTNDEKKSFIQGMKESSESTFKFLQNLLTWARTQTNKIQYIPSQIDLKSIVKECFDFLNVTSQDKNIKLISNIEEGKIVFVDKNMVYTILVNLLNNAIKFSNEGKTIYVGIKDENEDNLTIFVKDEGVGINDEDQKKLFHIESYHSTKGTKGETGTGLGLILVFEFVRINKGKIWIESKLGEGTTFFITLPKAA